MIQSVRTAVKTTPIHCLGLLSREPPVRRAGSRQPSCHLCDCGRRAFLSLPTAAHTRVLKLGPPCPWGPPVSPAGLEAPRQPGQDILRAALRSESLHTHCSCPLSCHLLPAHHRLLLICLIGTVSRMYWITVIFSRTLDGLYLHPDHI